MSNLRPYKGYMFDEKDPIIDLVGGALKSEGAKYRDVQENGGPVYGTLRNWFHGETRRPQFATIAAAFGALGYRRVEFVDSAGRRRSINLRQG